MNKKVRDTSVKAKVIKAERVELSSGNVFADLGFDDAEERLRQAQAAIKNSQKSRRAHKLISKSMNRND